MLSEAIKYLTTPCASHLRSMGYLKELIALEARFRRCQAAWLPHTQKTKSVICDAVNSAERKGKVVVLGAGILSDIPIEILAEKFEIVVLVDVCFLKPTQRNLHQHTNIKWQTSDVTGVAAPLFQWVRENQPSDNFPVPAPPRDIILNDADLVISGNLLSQLPLIPIHYLRKKKPSLEEETIIKFARAIIRNHLEFLDTCPGTICLISEIERKIFDGQCILETEDPLWGHLFAKKGEEWLWDIAPMSEISHDYGVRNRVRGSHWHHQN